MLFIRSKTVKGHRYYYVAESYREGGKVRQRYIASLGRHPTIDEALAALDDDDRADRKEIERLQREGINGATRARVRKRIAARARRRRQLHSIAQE